MSFNRNSLKRAGNQRLYEERNRPVEKKTKREYVVEERKRKLSMMVNAFNDMIEAQNLTNIIQEVSAVEPGFSGSLEMDIFLSDFVAVKEFRVMYLMDILTEKFLIQARIDSKGSVLRAKVSMSEIDDIMDILEKENKDGKIWAGVTRYLTGRSSANFIDPLRVMNQNSFQNEEVSLERLQKELDALKTVFSHTTITDISLNYRKTYSDLYGYIFGVKIQIRTDSMEEQDDQDTHGYFIEHLIECVHKSIGAIPEMNNFEKGKDRASGDIIINFDIYTRDLANTALGLRKFRHEVMHILNFSF